MTGVTAIYQPKLGPLTKHLLESLIFIFYTTTYSLSELLVTSLTYHFQLYLEECRGDTLTAHADEGHR